MDGDARIIRVELGSRSYSIVIKRGLMDEIGERMVGCGFSGRVGVVTNPVVGGLYLERLKNSLEGRGLKPVVIEIPDGEEYKSLEQASRIYDSLIEHRMDRNSPVVALGGGVVGDITGFVAATFLRGVPYVQVPTTLLAQVDSSVGGKTAVNHPRGKNLIGAFYQPAAVFIDPDTLRTLDVRELRAGLAEVVKYGVIWDREFFEFMEKNTDALVEGRDEIIHAIERSCAIKARVVSEDECEKGLRSILNFGHTFGHAIEAIAGFGSIKHGEAISMGMVMASLFSMRLGLCGQDVVKRIKTLLESIGLPVIPPPFQSHAFLETMKLDKKVLNDRLRFVLVEEPGRVTLKEVDEQDVEQFLTEFNSIIHTL